MFKSLSELSDTRLAGINTLPPSTSTLKPPFKICTTGALRTSLFSKASSSLLFAFSAASLLYDKATCPSPSLTLRTLTVSSSPTEITVVRSTGVLEYSSLVRIPSAL